MEKMKNRNLLKQQDSLTSRTAIEAEILFAVCLIKKQALTGGKSLARENKYSKKIGAESVVLHFVFFMIIINKMQQSAAQSCLGTFELRVLPFGKTSGTKLLNLLNRPTDRTFENRWSRYKEPSKNKAEAYRVYVEHLFLRSDARDARIFSKEVIHDGLGRISYTAKEGEVYIDGTNDQTQTGWNISSAVHYDKAGRKSEEGMPFFYGGNLEQELVNKNYYEALEAFYELNDFTTIRNGTKYEYDDIDRNILTTLPDGHTQKTEYSIDSSLQITKATDPKENISISKKDARGNIREVERLDKNGSVLTKARYEYSVLGEMLRAYDANENLLSVTYDLLGRRTSIESKDTGKKEWIYDDKGRLYAETDSVLKNKAAEIRYEYDGFDRIVKTDYPFSQDIEYKYGAHGQKGAGQIVYKKDETGETHYTYGNLNEVIKETRTINRYGAGTNPETASFEYRSDYLGRMQSMKYPDGETITYTYDKGGQLKGVSGAKTTNKGSIKYSYVDKILYDEHAQRVYIKYGNGVETRYKYDEKRRWLDSIETKNNQTQDVFQKIKYNFDAVGNVLGYANDATTYETQQTYSYDNLYQLISVEGTSNQYKGKKSFGMTPVSVAKYKQTFSFDNIGNMTNKLSTTNIPGSQGNSYPKAELDYNLDYEYDPAYAHRLVKAGTRYYRYDANGNITAEKDGPFTDEEEFTFTYSYFENEDVYGTDYGFGLDAPKETEQANPQDLFAYRRNYTWNERNLLTKSSDRNFTVHYRYGEDGQRALKYTDEGRSETLYFNNFFTIHIPTQDQNNPQGLRVHKHIFVGNSRLVTAMTHTDNSGDNEEQKAKRYYYHSDHLGSAQFVTDWKGRQYEHIEYTPYGELWIEEVAAGLDKLPFRFTGKELDEETGLYYYGARYLDPKYSRWLSGDPALGEYIPIAGEDNSKLPAGGIFNLMSFSLFNYANNNPIKYIDPTGRNPVYDIEGNLIGVTENSGLQGEAFIMNKEDYDAKMSLEDAKNKNLGIEGLNGERALNKFNDSFAGLKDRPDWDGKLTLEEANEWYKNGNGQELFVDINQIDLSMLYSLGDKYIGKRYVFNLFTLGSKDGKVYGSLTFIRYPNDTCRAFADKYDFDMKSWKNPLNWFRNIATIAGSVYAGKGVPYTINIYGSAQLKRKN